MTDADDLARVEAEIKMLVEMMWWASQRSTVRPSDWKRDAAIALRHQRAEGLDQAAEIADANYETPPSVGIAIRRIAAALEAGGEKGRREGLDRCKAIPIPVGHGGPGASDRAYRQAWSDYAAAIRALDEGGGEDGND
jgi:hypothetical protein